LLLACACLVAIAPFFWRGSPSGHDFEFHMFSWMEVLGQWKHGIVYPRWAALAQWGYGEARFLFYPPASWTLGAALGAILPWKIVPGAYCWILLMAAGASMYRLARERLQEADAVFAAVFYALNPYHLLIVYWRSAYAELLAAALLPLLLHCLLRLDQPGWRPTLWLSLILGAAWLTNAPAAVMIHYSAAGMALLLAIRGVVKERSWHPRVWRPIVRMLLVRMLPATLLGAGLASFYLVPAISEQSWINIGEVLSPGVRPQDNFLFTMIADPDHNRFNLLVSVVALAEIGVLVLAIWFSKRKESNHVATAAPSTSAGLAPDCPESRIATGITPDHRPWLLLSGWGIASALLMLSISNFFWQHLPKFRFVQLPFRWLLCMNAALALLLTMAAKRWTSRGLVSAALLIALVIAGYRIQPPWWDTSGDIHEMSDAIADGSGYEGADEYVPAGGDAYELKKDLPLLTDTDDAATPVRAEILEWAPMEKHFVVRAPKPERLELRLFNYPAWRVTVNGQTVAAETAEVTGQMIIPIPEGRNEVRIRFRRTIDRTIGNAISGLSFLLLAAAWIKTRRESGASVEQ
jgi:hypothetical protein